MARRFTYNRPLVKETKGDKTIYYFADDNPFDNKYPYRFDAYTKGNYFIADIVFNFKRVKEFFVGMYEYIFLKVRL